MVNRGSIPQREPKGLLTPCRWRYSRQPFDDVGPDYPRSPFLRATYLDTQGRRAAGPQRRAPSAPAGARSHTLHPTPTGGAAFVGHPGDRGVPDTPLGDAIMSHSDLRPLP